MNILAIYLVESDYISRTVEHEDEEGATHLDDDSAVSAIVFTVSGACDNVSTTVTATIRSHGPDIRRSLPAWERSCACSHSAQLFDVTDR